jgi:hypothetical protein
MDENKTNNLVAKHARKYNKAAVHKDRKKAMKKGDRKHKGSYESVEEVLKVSDGASAWIKDFQSSDSPQFKGKSPEKRKEMALAAYLDAKNGPVKEERTQLDEIDPVSGLIATSVGVRLANRARKIHQRRKLGKQQSSQANQDHHEARDYKKEYENYHSRPEQKKRRAARNGARRLLKNRKNIEGMDVHHKDNNPMNNDKSNLSIVTQNYNRKEPRLRKEHTMEEKKGLWDRIHAKRKRGEKPAKPGDEDYPKTLDVGEGLKQARKNVGADSCWDGYKAKGTKMKNGKEVPDCKKEEVQEAMSKVDIEGLPTIYVDGAPGAVKMKLRKMLRDKDMIRDVSRATDADAKKAYRKKAAGQEVDESAYDKFMSKKGIEIAPPNAGQRGRPQPKGKLSPRAQAKLDRNIARDKAASAKAGGGMRKRGSAVKTKAHLARLTREGAVKRLNKAKKNRIDREAGHQFRKDNPDLVGRPGSKHTGYGAQATAVGRALRNESAQNRLDNRAAKHGLGKPNHAADNYMAKMKAKHGEKGVADMKAAGQAKIDAWRKAQQQKEATSGIEFGPRPVARKPVKVRGADGKTQVRMQPAHHGADQKESFDLQERPDGVGGTTYTSHSMRKKAMQNPKVAKRVADVQKREKERKAGMSFFQKRALKKRQRAGQIKRHQSNNDRADDANRKAGFIESMDPRDFTDKAGYIVSVKNRKGDEEIKRFFNTKPAAQKYAKSVQRGPDTPIIYKTDGRKLMKESNLHELTQRELDMMAARKQKNLVKRGKVTHELRKKSGLAPIRSKSASDKAMDKFNKSRRGIPAVRGKGRQSLEPSDKELRDIERGK